jgi:aerobic carbon-monoxide dehydrogenase medium subunit
VKAPAFAYARPKSLEEALDLLERPGARALAGGQSLIPSLNMRLSAPDLLVDLNGLSSLRGISLEQGVVRIGALTTHSEIERDERVAKHVPLLAEAVRHVAHPAIRNRGTLGGSLALADPAAEYPACVLALKASIFVTGKKGERMIPAGEFFRGLFETALAPDELITAVEFRAIGKDERSAFLELTRRHGDYAIVGLAAHRSGSNRFVFFGVGSTPFFAKQASQASTLKEALEKLKGELEPAADLYHTSKTKLHLAGVLLERAWNTLSKPH